MFKQPTIYNKISKQHQFPNGIAVIKKLIKLKQFESNSPVNFVDIGCGTGDLLYKAFESVPCSLNSQFIGFDISEEMIRMAQQRYPNLEFHKAVAGTFVESLESDSIDVFFSNAVLHWLNLNDLEYLIRQCYRSLKKNGLIAFRFSLAENGENVKNFIKEYSNQMDGVIYKRAFTHKFNQTQDMLERISFKMAISDEIKETKKMTNSEILAWIKSTQQLEFGNQDLKERFFKVLEQSIGELKNQFIQHHGIFIYLK